MSNPNDTNSDKPLNVNDLSIDTRTSLAYNPSSIGVQVFSSESSSHIIPIRNSEGVAVSYFEETEKKNDEHYVVRIEINEPNSPQTLYKTLIYDTQDEADNAVDAMIEYINGTNKYTMVEFDQSYMFYSKVHGARHFGIFCHKNKNWQNNELTSEIDTIMNH